MQCPRGQSAQSRGSRNPPRWWIAGSRLSISAGIPALTRGMDVNFSLLTWPRRNLSAARGTDRADCAYEGRGLAAPPSQHRGALASSDRSSPSCSSRRSCSASYTAVTAVAAETAAVWKTRWNTTGEAPLASRTQVEHFAVADRGVLEAGLDPRAKGRERLDRPLD